MYEYFKPSSFIGGDRRTNLVGTVLLLLMLSRALAIWDLHFHRILVGYCNNLLSLGLFSETSPEGLLFVSFRAVVGFDVVLF